MRKLTLSLSQDRRRKRFVLQWQVSEHCNLNCDHCYMEAHPKDCSYEDAQKVISQFKDLLSQDDGCHPSQGHITLSGGEPFAKKDILDVIDAVAAERKSWTFAVLTNGTLIDEKYANYLSWLKPAFVQVSLDGVMETHDSIRGKGNYDLAFRGVKLLAEESINVHVSFTAMKRNFREFPDVVENALRAGASRVWSDRFVPCGGASEMDDEVLTPDETKEYVSIVDGMARKTRRRIIQRGCSTAGRALQFLGSNRDPYACYAGDTLLSLQPDGDLQPCRRMPVTVGNIHEESMSDIYENSDLLRKLRDPSNMSGKCESCSYGEACRGGLRCLSHAVHGTAFKPDPGCWVNADPADAGM